MIARRLLTFLSWDRTTRSHAIVKENQTEGERW